MAEQGSAGNIIAALCSVFCPGLGQLVQGRLFMACFFFFAVVIGWALAVLILPAVLAILFHLWSILDAARFSRPYRT